MTTRRDIVEALRPIVGSKSKVSTSKIGGFAGKFDVSNMNLEDSTLCSSADGVGTKIKVAVELNKHYNLGIDLVAMNVNDLACTGARPLFFQDYISHSNLELSTIKEIVSGVERGCELAGCAFVGGETSQMEGFYRDEEYDLAGFAVGTVKNKHILPSSGVDTGDIILGIVSNGIHSNGFTFIRKLMEDNSVSITDKYPYDDTKTIGDVLLKPTRIYSQAITHLLDKHRESVHGISHVTGGGLLDGLNRLFYEDSPFKNYTLTYWWSEPDIFKWVKQVGNYAEDDIMDLMDELNCGVGMLLLVKRGHAREIIHSLQLFGEKTFALGYVS